MSKIVIDTNVFFLSDVFSLQWSSGLVQTILSKLFPTIKQDHQHDECSSAKHAMNQKPLSLGAVIGMKFYRIKSTLFYYNNRNMFLEVSGARFPKKPGGTALVPRDMSLGRLTIDVNAHKSGTTRHGSPPDQTTEGTHCPVSITRNCLKLNLFTTHMTHIFSADELTSWIEILKSGIQSVIPFNICPQCYVKSRSGISFLSLVTKSQNQYHWGSSSL
ncbi:hypothetical protein PHYBLDRAFT_174095 [Phycomyces blakesleeanus NRRL 1555(-)]|uniref:Uncharacterized protein n=1 Tax=Phycomyces blakesleeanus (strain ATCC 8743b / DSM 1359 / FGSC 10004 / NBRC 33097 / NRRL 1555) TaxID=763407 RepID=A0A167KCS7_PHYB8|nr:hypothetical protein PHYBLDRAFT_174095 [Phycomyces blakesleeanus NRRL 1555(-)]OAD67777.1 hypothetical protein PHYBLDRAFT_174095 [Phycomyces blakesleeanus NRRL 1555(-)]|eukprot:XP_018285817.1 hypothetical protein PHYBLDRAFT_174095 [Phycomyces blakesleeanus NRRL 1555(-)]